MAILFIVTLGLAVLFYGYVLIQFRLTDTRRRRRHREHSPAIRPVEVRKDSADSWTEHQTRWKLTA